jgi:transcriptional accessory protein Tex/SPT6
MVDELTLLEVFERYTELLLEFNSKKASIIHLINSRHSLPKELKETYMREIGEDFQMKYSPIKSKLYEFRAERDMIDHMKGKLENVLVESMRAKRKAIK